MKSTLKDIPGFPGYALSPHGYVISKARVVQREFNGVQTRRKHKVMQPVKSQKTPHYKLRRNGEPVVISLEEIKQLVGAQ